MEPRVLNILADNNLTNDPSFPYWLYKIEFVFVSGKSFIKAFLFNKEFDNKEISLITFSYNNKEYKSTKFNIVSEYNNTNIVGVAFEIDKYDKEVQLKIIREVVDRTEYLSSNVEIPYKKSKFPKENDYLLSKNIDYKLYHEVFPTINNNYWQCSCGRIHSLDKNDCYCGLNKNRIESIINFNYTDNHIQDYLKTPIHYNLDKSFVENIELYKTRFFNSFNIDPSLLMKHIDIEAEEEKYNELIRNRDEEIKQNKARNKKILRISLAIIAFAIIVTICVKFIIPEVRYHIADSEFKKGNYDVAITKFENLNYKDSYDRALEVSYAKANNCVENNDYDEALQIFEELGDYSDSENKYYETIALKADHYYSLNNFKDCYEILYNNRNKSSLIPDYFEIFNKCAYNYGKELYSNNNYKESTSVLSTISLKYLDVVDVLKQSRSKYAEELYYNEDYEGAYKQIQKMGIDYTNEIHLDIIYNYASKLMSKGSSYYIKALTIFKEIKSYKDSEEKINECKYLYSITHKNKHDLDTYRYLKDLKSIGYKDSSIIYESLYKLSIELVAANTNPNDYSTVNNYINSNSSYFHMKIRLTGGEPSKSYTLSHNVIYPDGSIYYGTWKWENVYLDNSFGVEWTNGIHDRGTLKLNVYYGSTYIDTISVEFY